MRTMKRSCSNCRWYDDYSGACCNGKSCFCAEFMDKDFYCRKHEWNKRTDGKDVKCDGVLSLGALMGPAT